MSKLLFTALFLIYQLAIGQTFQLNGTVPSDFQNQNGKAEFMFKIVSIGWQETHPSVQVIDGYYSVKLGESNPLDPRTFDKNAVTIQTEYGYEGKGLVVTVYHQGEAIGQEPLFKNKSDVPSPRVQIPEIIDIPEEQEIEEEIEIDLDTEMMEEDVIEDIVFEEESNEEVFSIVENMPQFPGGEKKLYEFFIENTKYPAQAEQKGIQGRVYVEFIIGKTGEVRDVRVLKGIGSGCDEEAKRVAESLPDFTPGMQRGKPVNVKMMHPVNFSPR